MDRASFECYSSRIAKAYLIAAIMFQSAFGSSGELIDMVVAEVNGDPITYSDVQAKIRKKVLVEVSPYPASSKDSEFTVALQDSINLKLILQKAEELNIDISDEDLEQEIEKFMQRRQLTRAALKQALGQEGMTYEQYKQDWRKQMLISQFQGREIMPSVKITDKDIEIYYLQKTGATGESLKLTLRQLFIRIPQDGPESVKLGKEEIVQKVFRELKDGLDFKKAVKVYSDSESSRKNAGSMPPVLIKDLNPVFQKAVADLDEKQFTQPVRVSQGVYFFYLEKKEFAGSYEFTKAKGQLEQQLRQEQIVEHTMKWIQSQRSRSKIRVIN